MVQMIFDRRLGGVEAHPLVIRRRAPARKDERLAVGTLDEPVAMVAENPAGGGRQQRHRPDTRNETGGGYPGGDLGKRSGPGVALVEPVALERLIAVVDLHHPGGEAVALPGKRAQVFHQVVLGDSGVVIIP
ncbi:hypothetical protein SDC9_166916 [bioreactor metagenome]|uniref:Uncharacterized protein n=1 Tax=bioreactor metagenome TaxID=1076179 RepID=A0A645FYP7_9ZZZZ